ncbi:MAG: hypothetical protein UV59_C0040G0011 [Candidatus Gottesmanbacteria bacterium GW2011_GWA1_43_11]|uniref:Uncharacterized protein n=1 Tax=Candidatus Gottesmanbacteria bacterium GW2011_GWA1_43_11 TaxID=1618436 RepID=A0A0G1CDC7_9BACT|nr:MAG: hypothetical protein UV59_C0040G0011 [Candidatus Gottesmanbacteria bacterium GW2011_GWA1_43_11]
MVAETCCRPQEGFKDKPKRWVLSQEAKGAIHDFSKRVLEVAEEIRKERGYPNDPQAHFFANGMQKYHYFVNEASDDYLDQTQVPTLPSYQQDLKLDAIGAISFYGSVFKDKSFKSATIKEQKELLMLFLEKLGFKANEQTSWQKKQTPENEFHHYPTIKHPTWPITAEFGEQKSDCNFAHIWFSYHELNEHQLPLPI